METKVFCYAVQGWYFTNMAGAIPAQGTAECVPPGMGAGLMAFT